MIDDDDMAYEAKRYLMKMLVVFGWMEWNGMLWYDMAWIVDVRAICAFHFDCFFFVVVI